MAMSSPALKTTLAPAVLIDVAGRSLLLFWMIFSCRGAWLRAASVMPLSSLDGFLIFVSEIGSFLFAALIILLVVIRPPARGRAPELRAHAAALGASFTILFLYRMPIAPLPTGWSLAAAVLLALGNLATVYCLAWLGSSFSLLPEARRLVREGPYRFVRHPLYLTEGIAMMGLILSHWGFAALAVGAVQVALQLYRLRQEERTLTAAFPDYADYAAVTPRLFPRLVRRR